MLCTLSRERQMLRVVLSMQAHVSYPPHATRRACEAISGGRPASASTATATVLTRLRFIGGDEWHDRINMMTELDASQRIGQNSVLSELSEVDVEILVEKETTIQELRETVKVMHTSDGGC